LLLLIFFFLVSTGAAKAWDDAWRDQYPVGSNVIASPVSDSSDWRKATVVENVPGGLLRVKVEAGNGRPGGVYIISGPSDIKPLTASIQGAPVNATPANATPANIAAHSAPHHTSTSQGGNSFSRSALSSFKIGETVWVSPVSDSTDWRKATVVENPPGGLLRVQVEAGNGRPGGVYIISGPSDIKPYTGAVQTTTAAATGVPIITGHAVAATGVPTNISTAGNLSVGPAPATVKDTSPKQPGQSCCPPQADLSGTSLEAICKQTIRDRYMENGRSFDVGRYPATITFHNFSISGPRPYRMPGAYAYHTGSPDGPGGKQGTQVYDVKTKYTVCVDEQPSTQYGYKGYVNFADHDTTYFAFKHYQTGEWLLNQDSDKIDRRQVAK
jgi:hypothetical protein